MHDLSQLATSYGKHNHRAYIPEMQSASFHRLMEVDGNLVIHGDADLAAGLHRDPDTINFLRLMESIGNPIKPEPDFKRYDGAMGIHFFKGSRGTADGKFFEFAMQPLDDYQIFSQRQWGSEWGWLFPYLYRDSYVLNERWFVWDKAGLEPKGSESIAIATIEPVDIVYEYPDRIKRLFHDTFDLFAPGWREDDQLRYFAMLYLFKWMLYGLGHPMYTKKPEPIDWLSPCSFDILAQIIPSSIKLFLLWPRAHFSYLLEEFSEMAKTHFIPNKMPSEEQLKCVDTFLLDAVKSPLDIVFIHEANGPLLVTASNHSNMIIPTSSSPIEATAGIIDLYLQAPFTAIPCGWEFTEAGLKGKEALVVSFSGFEFEEPLIQKRLLITTHSFIPMSSKPFVEYHGKILNLETPFPYCLSDYLIEDFVETHQGQLMMDKLQMTLGVWRRIKQINWKYKPNVAVKADIVLNRRIREFVEAYIQSHPLGFFLGSHMARNLNDSSTLFDLRDRSVKQHYLFSLDLLQENHEEIID